MGPLALLVAVCFAGGVAAMSAAGLAPSPADALWGAALTAAFVSPLVWWCVVCPLRRAMARRWSANHAAALIEAQRLSRVDPLTGLLNRRGVEERIAGMREEGASFAIAIADLDGFKVLNDTHGHAVGDRALRLFAHTLAASIRPQDEAARFGGEEFVVLLPGADLEAATAVLERVRVALRRALHDADLPPFTSSFGVAASARGAAPAEVLEAADRALYAAKRAGRDRVVVCGS